MNKQLASHIVFRFRSVYWLVLLSLPLILSDYAQAADVNNIAVLYERVTFDTGGLPQTTQFEWFFLYNPAALHTYSLGDEVSSASPVALAPNSPYIALANEEGWVYIYNLAERSFVNLHVQTYHRTTFACADESAPFGTITEGAPRDYIQWSPDGTQLAFVGATTCGRFDIYVYSLATETLTDVTSHMDIYMMGYLSWSPDGNWLAFTAAWEQERIEGVLPSVSIPTIISSDGTTSQRLTSRQRVCALSWSPDQRHLASVTECTLGVSDFSEAVILTFDPDEPHTVFPSVTLAYDADDEFYHNYRRQAPVWLDDQQVIFLRVSVPRGRINLTPADFVTQFLVYDVVSDTLTSQLRVDPDQDGIEVIDDWAVWNARDNNQHLTIQAHNLITGQVLGELADFDMSLRNLRFDQTGRFLAGHERQSANHNNIYVFDAFTGDTIAHITVETGQEEVVRLLGFLEFSE